MNHDPESEIERSRKFATTQWSLVLSAARQSSPHCRDALDQLCETYWTPLYWHVRRLGYDTAVAQDLTQGFFSRLLEKRVLGYVDRERGKFRSFLLVSLRNYLANERDREQAEKRGGGKTILSMNFDSAEQSYALEPSHDLTAERLFDKRWALAVLEKALAELEQQYREANKRSTFESLVGYLTADDDAPKYAEMAQQLDMTDAAVKMAVSRLRQRYRQLIRAEVRRTISDSDDVEDEMRSLLDALA